MKIKTKDLAFIAIFIAILAILSQIAIPSPSGVPLTLQTFGIALIAYFLGWKKGLLAFTIYLLLGIIGIPVFANLKTGFQVLIGPTGGFLIGFFPFLILSGLRTKNKILPIFLGIFGLMICHLIGIGYFSFLTKRDYLSSFLLVSAPYIIKDIASVILAYVFAKVLNKRLSLGI